MYPFFLNREVIVIVLIEKFSGQLFIAQPSTFYEWTARDFKNESDSI